MTRDVNLTGNKPFIQVFQMKGSITRNCPLSKTRCDFCQGFQFLPKLISSIRKQTENDLSQDLFDLLFEKITQYHFTTITTK